MHTDFTRCGSALFSLDQRMLLFTTRCSDTFLGEYKPLDKLAKEANGDITAVLSSLRTPK